MTLVGMSETDGILFLAIALAIGLGIFTIFFLDDFIVWLSGQ